MIVYIYQRAHKPTRLTNNSPRKCIMIAWKWIWWESNTFKRMNNWLLSSLRTYPTFNSQTVLACFVELLRTMIILSTNNEPFVNREQMIGSSHVRSLRSNFISLNPSRSNVRSIIDVVRQRLRENFVCVEELRCAINDHHPTSNPRHEPFQFNTMQLLVGQFLYERKSFSFYFKCSLLALICPNQSQLNHLRSYICNTDNRRKARGGETHMRAFTLMLGTYKTHGNKPNIN